MGCDAVAAEMNRCQLGQEQINLNIIAEKKKELCHTPLGNLARKSGFRLSLFSCSRIKNKLISPLCEQKKTPPWEDSIFL